MVQKRLSKSAWHRWISKTAGKGLTMKDAGSLFLRENFPGVQDAHFKEYSSPYSLLQYLKETYVERSYSKLSTLH